MNTKKVRPSRFQALAGIALIALMAGCATQKHVRQGDKLLRVGKFDAALEAYEAALVEAPDSRNAQKGIRRARRGVVRKHLRRAESLLAESAYAEALSLAMRTRRMPLDLEDVALAKRIDSVIKRSASEARERVAAWVDEGRYVPAVELSRKVVEASPAARERQQWSAQLAEKAAAHYSKLAGELKSTNMSGSAALQLAMAKQVGAEINVTEVAELWDRFTGRVCFATPDVAVTDASKEAGSLVSAVQDAAQHALAELQAACGVGERPLGIQITLAKFESVDNTKTVQAPHALPGSGIETEEIYYEEIPYVVEEEVTVDEVKKVRREFRDCAPRPGAERGCRTWFEDVEERVPVVKLQKVKKTKRVERKRIAKGPFPAGKVVMYPLTTVKRGVRYSGHISVTGSGIDPYAFSVTENSVGRGHPVIEHGGEQFPEVVLEVATMQALTKTAGNSASDPVGKAVAAAVGSWAKMYATEARQHEREGKLAQAEEVYLRLLALGVHDSKELTAFFEKRYGRPVGQVMGYMREAMGFEAPSGKAGDALAAGMAFPRRELTDGAVEAEPEAMRPTVKQLVQINAAPVATAGNDVSAMADDELKRLEAASIADGSQTGEPGLAAVPEGTDTAEPVDGAALGAPPEAADGDGNPDSAGTGDNSEEKEVGEPADVEAGEPVEKGAEKPQDTEASEPKGEPESAGQDEAVPETKQRGPIVPN